ncbi:MAG: hypothetical protein KC583_23925 [Myxococcales bacterium]|nr:hypothetical protein [Myxococcales bacterium]
MNAYYYRAGRRVPVHLAASAMVSARGCEPHPPEGWRTLSLTRDQQLIVHPDIVIAAPSLERRPVLAAVLATAERGPSVTPGAGLYPVLVPKDGRLLLFPTGTVVAHCQSQAARGAVDAHCAAQGWSVERPIRFLEGGLVLRPRPGVDADPVGFANLLFEDVGCRFAHPVFLEEVAEPPPEQQHAPLLW